MSVMFRSRKCGFDKSVRQRSSRLSRNPLCDRAALHGKQPMQVPHGDAGRRRDDCRAESRFLQMSLDKVFDARPELRAAAQFG
jgi:hypothetical protein